MESIVNVESKLNEKIKFIRYNAVVLGKIEELNLKFLEGLKLIEGKEEINRKYYDHINNFSDLAEYKLNIQTLDDFNKTIAYIEIADLLINRGIKDLDEEPLLSGFYNLEDNLNKLNIFKE